MHHRTNARIQVQAYYGSVIATGSTGVRCVCVRACVRKKGGGEGEWERERGGTAGLVDAYKCVVLLKTSLELPTPARCCQHQRGVATPPSAHESPRTDTTPNLNSIPKPSTSTLTLNPTTPPQRRCFRRIGPSSAPASWPIVRSHPRALKRRGSNHRLRTRPRSLLAFLRSETLDPKP